MAPLCPLRPEWAFHKHRVRETLGVCSTNSREVPGRKFHRGGRLWAAQPVPPLPLGEPLGLHRGLCRPAGTTQGLHS